MKNQISPHHSFAQRILHSVLAMMARAIIWRHDPFIIGVTGSIGKTSTKDAIAHVLASHFDVYKTQKNYNNEIGLPLTIIRSESGGSSPILWLRVCGAWAHSFLGTYPEVLVLEYGIDSPGDMTVLTRIAAPHIAVVTRISDAHRAFFESTKEIAREKGFLIESLSKHSNEELPCAAVLNADDPLVFGMRSRTQKSVYTYGTEQSADLHATHIARSDDGVGLVFKLGFKERSIPMRLPHIIARHQVSSVLAALNVAHILKINVLESANSLQTYSTPPSRMRLLVGTKGQKVIDDTYNSSPDAVHAALETLGSYENSRRVAILGDMLELGDQEITAHNSLAKVIIDQKVNVIICVGERMRTLYENLYGDRSRFLGDIFHVMTPHRAAEKLQEITQSDDVVLIKGSQGMRMEIVVCCLVSDNFHENICRQDTTWKAREFIQP